MNNEIVPFGKHKGKPIEILATDKQYLDWLLSQSWFKEKYLNIYNVIINNFQEPVDTPEHNKMQIKFLKTEYRLKLAFLLNPNLFDNNSEKINQKMNLMLDSDDHEKSEYFLKSMANPDLQSEFGIYTNRLLKLSTPIFEKVDVQYTIWYGLFFYYERDRYSNNLGRFDNETRNSFQIEIKPTISDDYPTVLRQMKAAMPALRNRGSTINEYSILLVGEYNGIGASKTDFIDFFETQGYKVIFEKDIEKITLPVFEQDFIIDKEIKNKISTVANIV